MNTIDKNPEQANAASTPLCATIDSQEMTPAVFDLVWCVREGAVSELEGRWESLWERLDLVPRMGLFETAISRWTEPHRSYHTPQHLLECLKVHAHLAKYSPQANIVELALWYHDIIYNVSQHDNEERSADLACATFTKSGGSPIMAEELRQIVLATSHRHPVKSIEAAITVDADLAILGAPKDRFDEYEQQVRNEYAQIEDRHFAAGRIKALSPFLSRKQIFRTPLMRSLLETRAQANLTRSVRALQKLLA